MSYDLAVWEGPLPVSDAEAGVVYQDRAHAADEHDDLPPSPVIREFIEELVARWPEGRTDGPWSVEPLIEVAVGGFAVVPMTFDSVEEVEPFLVHEAEVRGLVCYDPQAERLLPDSTDDESEWTYRGQGTLPAGALLRLDVEQVPALLGMSAARAGRIVPRIRPDRDGEIDFADLLTLQLLAVDDLVPAWRWVIVGQVIRDWWDTCPNLDVPAMLVVDDETEQLATPEVMGTPPVGSRQVFDLSGSAAALLTDL